MKIFLRLDIVALSRAALLSLSVCHTEGKGDTIKWTIGTPRREKKQEETQNVVYRESYTVCRWKFVVTYV